MAEVRYSELQRLYGGRYVARRDADVIASAADYDGLIEHLGAQVVDWTEVVIEYVEPTDIVCVY